MKVEMKKIIKGHVLVTDNAPLSQDFGVLMRRNSV